MIGFTRAVSPRIVACELSFLDRQPIDFARAVSEHDAYERALESLGCSVVHVDPAPEHPDGVFVEDAAVILDGYAVVMHPGAASRRGETASVARALEEYLPLRRLQRGTIDGGDVLVIEKTIYVGRSARTSDEGIAELASVASEYKVVPIDFHGCLHLKSAVTSIAPNILLANPEWVDTQQFKGFEIVTAPEPHAANALRIRDTIILGSSYTRTRAELERLGHRVLPVPIDELAKAEAGVTCCSLICLYC